MGVGTMGASMHNFPEEDYSKLDEAISKPVLDRSLFTSPVIIESVSLLEHDGNYICRVRSKDGAEGIAVGHNISMGYLYPIQVKLVNPFFIGKDARDLDSLIDNVVLHKNLYKYQGYAIWIPIATVEIAILDMLGRIALKSMGALIGGGTIHQKQIAIYQANENRGLEAEESIRRIKHSRDEFNARAVKFKIGGREGNAEKPTGISRKLIAMMRKAMGDDITIYADANGSYNAKEGIEIGRLLEEYRIDLFEQPTSTDWYEDWKAIADAVRIPIGSGGGEVSMRGFRRLIATESVQMVQQDIYYFGGMIRCMKVARMAETKGYVCTPHISGTGLGYIYMMQFVSALTNAGPFHEFKGLAKNIPITCNTSSLKPENGILHLPTGVGSGVEIDPDFISKHKIVS